MTPYTTEFFFIKKNNDFDFYNIFYETSFLDLAGTQLQNVMFYSIYATTRLAKLKFARIRFHLLSAHGSIPLFWNELVYSYGFTSK